MTIQQLQYVTSVEKYKTFTAAAEKCFVTQPTLTMQIKKLEDELGISLFDRSQTPVKPTPAGRVFIGRAKEILESFEDLKTTVKDTKGDLSGVYRLAIIPTVAPYLLPYFLPKFTETYPDTTIEIREMTTRDILSALHDDEIDMAIASTPLDEREIKERKLYEESFLLYSHEAKSGVEMSIEDLNEDNLLMMDEGHCFRNQTINLCQHQDTLGQNFSFRYLGGSIMGLVNLVEKGIGMTLVPELAINHLPDKDKIQSFRDPQPAREISLVYHRRFNRDKLIQSLSDLIITSLPEQMNTAAVSKKIIPWK